MASSPDLPEQLARLLLRLLAIPSPSFHERQLCDYLEIRLRAVRGAAVERIGDNLVVTVPAARGRPRVLFAGHLDTVPPQDNLVPVREGDRIHGLGAADLKASLAVLWLLLEEMPLGSLPIDPVIVLYRCEEVAFEASGLLEVVAAAPWIREVAFAVCVEPTANRVEFGCLGTLHARVSVQGRTAHSARPWQGKNAIHALAPLLQKLADHPIRDWSAAEGLDILYREVIQVTRIEGGRARNVLPDRAEMSVNFRFAPDRSPEQAREYLLQLVGPDVEVEFTDIAPAGHVCHTSPYARSLLRHTGEAPRAKQAWTDVGRFTEWGVDAISFGPGNPEQAHQKDEFASIEAMVQNYGVLGRWLREGAREGGNR